MTVGHLPYDAGHLLGVAMLVLSFVLLTQRRLAGVINSYALQAMALAAALAWQAWVQAAPALYLAAFIALAAKGIAVPWVLHGMIRRMKLDRAVPPVVGIFPSLAFGAGLVTLAIFLALPTPRATREDLALALSVVLVGLLTMTTRRTALPALIGWLSLENGLVLAAAGVAGMPAVLEFSLAALLLLALAMFYHRIKDRFATPIDGGRR